MRKSWERRRGAGPQPGRCRPKGRRYIAIGALVLLFMMLASLADTRSADAPLRKATATPSEEGALTTRHAPRTLSRSEIFRAIQDDLAQRGISSRKGLTPEDLNIQSSVPVLQEDMGLHVKRIGFDPIRRETVFELWTSHEPQFLPFQVTTRRDPRSWGFNPPPEWNMGVAGGVSRTGSSTISQAGRPKPPVLVKPGRPATLMMLGQNVRITITVMPLQPGAKGQSILVRDVTTARVMAAEVVDEGLLQTRF